MALSVADVNASAPVRYDEFEARLRELEARVGEVGRAKELAEMRPSLDGDEIMALLHIPPGPRVGEVQRYLLERQVEGEIETEEEARREVLERFGSSTQNLASQQNEARQADA